MTAEGLVVQPKIILASASPSRAAVLSQARVPFEINVSGVDEEPTKRQAKQTGASAIDAADSLAALKATTVSIQNPKHFVIGADQILYLDGQWFDKPATVAEARSNLSRFRGRTHHLATAVVVAFGGKRIWHTHDHPALTMRKFSEVFLDQYISAAGDSILASVGGYHLEGLGAQLFERVDGSFFSILGLPLLPTLAYLRECGAITR